MCQGRPAPWVTRPTQCLPTDKYLMPIPDPVNSQGFPRDTASNPPGIFHSSKNCRLGRPGYFPNCRLNFPAAFSRRRIRIEMGDIPGGGRACVRIRKITVALADPNYRCKRTVPALTFNATTRTSSSLLRDKNWKARKNCVLNMRGDREHAIPVQRIRIASDTLAD
jgi:hypothetical protein